MSHRAFCENLSDKEVAIEDSEAHHLLHVLRLKPGDMVTLFDGRGTEANCTIVRTNRREVFCVVTEVRASAKDSAETLTVIAAPPKGDRLKWMVEKLTEIGVHRLILLQSERTIVTAAESRIDKLRTTVISACKQSRRNVLMDISPLQPLSSVLSNVHSQCKSGNKFIAHPGTQVSSSIRADRIPALANAVVGPRVLIIGPEGGFTETEYRAAVDVGCRSIYWPDTILRIETAAVVFAALLSPNGS